MRSFDYINKEWIVSPTARRVYRAAAIASFFLFSPAVAILLNEPVRSVRGLVFIGVLGTALDQIGMEYYLFRFDDSAAWKQILWFGVMLIPPFGPALYCFFVYSRARVFAVANEAQDTALNNSPPSS